MTFTKPLFIAVSISLMISSTVCFAHPSTTEEGKRLFNNPELAGSSTDKSCNSCHNDGKGLEQSVNNPKIEQQINRCIVGALQAKPLELDSREMLSLKKYLVSLGQ
jgi:cytochrome c553